MKKNKKKIFLIEDDIAIIDVYKMAFQSTDIEVESIMWGNQAIEKIRLIQGGGLDKPSIVLLDLILPDISGVEILKAIKQHEKTRDIIVIVLSNYTNEEFGKTEDTKPDKFILKASIAPTELVKLVQDQFKKIK